MEKIKQDEDVQRAISDIAMFKQILLFSEQERIDSKLVGVTLEANLLLQSLGFICALSLTLLELTTSTFTSMLLNSAEKSELKDFAIIFVGMILAGLVILCYFIVWRAARHNDENINAFITRNFKYLRILSFISDLLMKYIAIALAIFADKPEWVAPLFVAFTGDYLLQNRFFTLQAKMSVAMGMICIATAIYLFIFDLPSLAVPFCLFTFVCGISATRLLKKFRRLESPVGKV